MTLFKELSTLTMLKVRFKIILNIVKSLCCTLHIAENIVKTRMAQDVGRISKRGIERLLRGENSALQSLSNGRKGLMYGEGNTNSLSKTDQLKKLGIRKDKSNQAAVIRKKVYEANSHRKIVDTEDVHNISRRDKNGKVTSETVRTEKHEVYDDKEAPDDRNSYSSGDQDYSEHHQEHYRRDKTDEFVDYYRINEKTGRRQIIGNGTRMVSENVEHTVPQQSSRWFFEEEEERIRQRQSAMRRKLHPGECSDAERKDALTRRPLNFMAEEKTRRKETDKWLERHFGGSEWSLFNDSLDSSALARRRILRQEEVDQGFRRPQTATGTRGNFEDFDSKVRRTQSFSCIPINYTNPAGKTSRIIKQTTTTYRPGFDKVVFSSVTKNIVPPSDGLRPYHSTNNINHQVKDQIRDQGHRPYHSSTSLVEDAGCVRNVPITIDDDDNDEPKRPARRTRGPQITNNRVQALRGEVGIDKNYYENRKDCSIVREDSYHHREKIERGRDRHGRTFEKYERVQSAPGYSSAKRNKNFEDRNYVDSPENDRKSRRATQNERRVHRSESTRK